MTIRPAFGKQSTPIVAVRSFRGAQSLLTEDAPVAIYFAATTVGLAQGIGGALYDLQSIQVLKGPQCSHFGCNTRDGALHVDPKYSSFPFDASPTQVADSSDRDFANISKDQFNALLKAGAPLGGDAGKISLTSQFRYVGNLYLTELYKKSHFAVIYTPAQIAALPRRHSVPVTKRLRRPRFPARLATEWPDSVRVGEQSHEQVLLVRRFRGALSEHRLQRAIGWCSALLWRGCDL